MYVLQGKAGSIRAVMIDISTARILHNLQVLSNPCSTCTEGVNELFQYQAHTIQTLADLSSCDESVAYILEILKTISIPFDVSSPNGHYSGVVAAKEAALGT